MVVSETRHLSTMEGKRNTPENIQGIPSVDMEQRWVSAIERNDSFAMESIISEVSAEVKEALVNGVLTRWQPCGRLSPGETRILQVNKETTVNCALCLAGVFAAYDALEILLKLDVNIHQKSCGGKNILHCLAHVSKLDASRPQQQQQQTVAVYEWLVEHLPGAGLAELLSAEDEDGLRPLELACHLCALDLADHLLQTEGVYRTTTRRGIYQDLYYCLTPYEGITGGGGHCYRAALGQANRREKSPISLLINSPFATKSDLLLFAKEGPLRLWAEAKASGATVVVFCSFVGSLTHAALFVLFDLYVQSAASSTEPSAATVRNWTLSTDRVSCYKVGVNLSRSQAIAVAAVLVVLTVLRVFSYVIHLGSKAKDRVISAVRYFKGTRVDCGVAPSDYPSHLPAFTSVLTMAYMVLLLRRHTTRENTTENSDINQILVMLNIPALFFELLQFGVFLSATASVGAAAERTVELIPVLLALFFAYTWCQGLVLHRLVTTCPPGGSYLNSTYIYQSLRALLGAAPNSRFSANTASATTLLEFWYFGLVTVGSLLLVNLLLEVWRHQFLGEDNQVSRSMFKRRLRLVYNMEATTPNALLGGLCRLTYRNFVHKDGDIFLAERRFACFEQTRPLASNAASPADLPRI